MTSYINNIKTQFSGADQWPILYPWFSIGHLFKAAENINMPGFQEHAQKAAVYFNDIHRLHWLLHQPEIDTEKIITNPIIEINNENEVQPVTPEETFIEQEHVNHFKNSSLSQSLEAASKQLKEDHITKDDELIFQSEPYHTIDYFASQGIKLEEPKADDKFGQQLKSFTSWLKQMKKLSVAKPAEKDLDPVVENIASHSLKEGDIVTESMAEVLLKQGKISQAIDVWRKLSLLYPEKSHYFAALIEKQTFKK